MLSTFALNGKTVNYLIGTFGNTEIWLDTTLIGLFAGRPKNKPTPLVFSY